MYSYKIQSDVDSEKWKKELLTSDHSTFFQTSEFLETTHLGDRFSLFVYVLNDKGEVKGQLGLVIINVQRAYSTPLLQLIMKVFSALGKRGTWLSGPIIHSNDKKERIEILRVFLKALDQISNDYNLAVIDGYSPPQDFLIDEDYKNEFRNNEYTVENFFTFVTDLTKSVEEIWKNITKKARGDVTRAERRNIIAREIQTYDELKEYFLLAKRWAETKGIELTKHIPLEKYWNSYKAGIDKFFVAYQDNELISGIRVGCFNGIAYSHQILSSYSKTTSLGGPLLTWHVLQWAKNSGLRLYDFSGGEAPPQNGDNEKWKEQWESLLSYKRKWGGIEYPYYHFVKIRRKNAYNIFRILTKLDWQYREYKKRRFTKPTKDEEIEEND